MTIPSTKEEQLTTLLNLTCEKLSAKELVDLGKCKTEKEKSEVRRATLIQKNFAMAMLDQGLKTKNYSLYSRRLGEIGGLKQDTPPLDIA